MEKERKQERERDGAQMEVKCQEQTLLIWSLN